jgi:hypothetical protein
MRTAYPARWGWTRLAPAHFIGLFLRRWIMNLPTMNSRVKGIKKYTDDTWVTGMPLVINGEMAIVPESEIKNATFYKDEITVKAFLIRLISFQFIPEGEDSMIDFINFNISFFSDKDSYEKVDDVYRRYMAYNEFTPEDVGRGAMTRCRFVRALKKDSRCNYVQKKIEGIPTLCFIGIKLNKVVPPFTGEAADAK